MFTRSCVDSNVMLLLFARYDRVVFAFHPQTVSLNPAILTDVDVIFYDFNNYDFNDSVPNSKTIAR